MSTRTALLGESAIEGSILQSKAFRTVKSTGRVNCCLEKKKQLTLVPFDDWPKNESSDEFTCPSHRFCIESQVKIPGGLSIGPLVPPAPLNFGLPRFTPMINPLDRRTFAHLFVPGAFPALVVQAWPLFLNKEAFRRVQSKGLADTLNYDGKTVLTSVMPDRFILENDVNWYVRVIKALNPSAAITWDVPTYHNHPQQSSLGWVLEGVDSARKMSLALDIPLIGLVSGASLAQVELSSSCLGQLGFEDQGLACREYVKARQFRYLEACVRTVKKMSSSLMMLSCSSPSLFSRFTEADYLVGMNWFNSAYRGKDSLESRPKFVSVSKFQFNQLARKNLLAAVKASEQDSGPPKREVLRFG